MSSNVKVMRADRSMCEVPSDFMEKHGENLFYAKADNGVWVPKCDLGQYNAGTRTPRATLVELIQMAGEKAKQVNVMSDDIVRFSFNYKGEIELHLDSITIAIHAVNAIAAGVEINFSDCGVDRKHVEFDRYGMTFVGIVDAQTVREWNLPKDADRTAELVASL